VLPSSPSPRSPAATGLEVRPFRALTYRRRDPEHLARVSSPAYDLVTPSGRNHLADADPHNIVRLILPRVDRSPADDAAEGGDRAAGAAAPLRIPPCDTLQEPALHSAELAERTLRSWLAERVLVADDVAALWLYELTPGERVPTLGWLGAVRLPPAGSSAVLPHEDTYPAAVEGRRALLEATRTDLEPIVLAHDSHPVVAEVTARARDAEPTLAFIDEDGVRHRLWRVVDPDVIGGLAEAWADTGAVIADGHHRFAAAQAHHRAHPSDPGSDAVLALVTPMGPGGLRVEPIHRVLPDLDFERAVESAAVGFRTVDLPTGGDPAAVARVVSDWLGDPAESGFLLSDGRRVARLTDPSDEVRAAVPAEAPAAWRHLDVVLAHAGLLDHLWHRTDEPASVLIAHDVREALRLAAERTGVALLLRAPSPVDVAAVARAGARMPRKSTLFVPKPRTGLVLRPLTG
jgi:uncharacterized protein (DUF1015 family)